MRRLLLAAIIVTLATAGCLKARPKTGPQAAAPLDVPPPPPRVIALPEPEQPPEATTPVEPEPTKEKRPNRPRPQAPRDRADAIKPPVEPPKPETVPPPAAESAKPSAPASSDALQPAQQASTPEMIRQIEGQLAQARNDLRKVDQRNLSADARTQYQTAQQFITQSGTALKEGNLVFAQKLAEKAVGLESNLVPR